MILIRLLQGLNEIDEQSPRKCRNGQRSKGCHWYQECTVDISGAEQVDVGLMQNKWWDGILGGGNQFRARFGGKGKWSGKEKPEGMKVW